jgi:protease II
MIACAEHLAATGYSAADRIVVRGGSAGGLLVGACVTMRPDLWAGGIAEVPFVDVVTTMHDETLPLTVPEWEEWGNPKIPEQEQWLLGYSPYDRTVPASYPALYVTAGFNDPRVSYHEPAKWVAKLRSVQQGDAPIVFKTELGAGHGGPSGRYDAWKDEARTLAFFLWASGVISADADRATRQPTWAATAAAANSAPLRTTADHDSGFTDSCPKQAHGGRRSCNRFSTSNAVNPTRSSAARTGVQG